MKKEHKILSIVAISVVLIIGLLVITSGALDPDSRFYGEWTIVDTVESSNIFESLYADTSSEGFHITFEPDMDLQITIYLDNQPVATIYGTYTIISDTQMYMTVSGEISDTLKYSFSNRNMVLTLTEETSGDTMVLNKIQDL